jgi:hypothetical protein
VSSTETRVAVVLVNGRVYCGPLLRVGRDVKLLAASARTHAHRTGREREVDSAMLDRWEAKELARRRAEQQHAAEGDSP